MPCQLLGQEDSLSRFKLGLAAVVMLVLLRVSIGWHFMYEGVWKLQNPSYSAEGFFRQAHGPLADRFHALIPDYDGTERLNAQKMSERWDNYRRKMAKHYNLTDEQDEQIGAIYSRYDRQLQQYLTAAQPEIDKYSVDWKKLEESRENPAVEDMPHMKKRTTEAESKLRSQSAAWLNYVDDLEANYKAEARRVLTKKQLARGDVPGERTSLQRIDQWTAWGLTAIGVGLLVGLFTRLSSVAGALFLLTVILAQPAWPGAYPPPHPSAGHSLLVNKEFIEMMALAALATTHVGRWGGLDFFIHHLLIRPIFGKRKPNEPKS